MALSHSPSIVTDGLILCLDAANIKSYPGTGTTWFDISGRENHFTLVNGPVFAGGNKFIFDGVNDSANSTNTINFSTNTITIQLILKANSYPTYNGNNLKFIFEHSNNWNNNEHTFIHYYVADQGSGDIVAGTRGPLANGFVYNFGVFDKSLYNDLRWKFVNIVFDRRVTGSTPESSLYTQGSVQTPINSTTNDFSDNFATNTLYLAARGGASFFADFELSYFSIYSRVLNQSEIIQNYNALRGRFGI